MAQCPYTSSLHSMFGIFSNSLIDIKDDNKTMYMTIKHGNKK